jgi:hypothetical protein
MGQTIGWILLSLAAFIAAMNFYFSFLRYPIYRLMGWKYRWVSGAPVVGSIFLVVGLLFLWWLPAAWWRAGVIALFDTGGFPWFLVVMFLMTFVWSKPGDTRSEKHAD